MIPAFLLKNPLASGMGVLCLVLGLACGLQTLRLAWAADALATEKLAFADFKTDLAVKSLKVVNDAAAKSAEQVEKLTQEVRTVGLIGAQAKTEIRYVQSNGGPCAADPVYRATVGSVQRILDAGNPGGDKGQAGGGAAPALRRADPAGSGKKP